MAGFVARLSLEVHVIDTLKKLFSSGVKRPAEKLSGTIFAGAGAVKNTSAATWEKTSRKTAGKRWRVRGIPEDSFFPLEAGKRH